MKKTITKSLPIFAIICVWLIFVSPAVLTGAVPFPSDYLVSFFAPWSAYPELFTPVKNDAMPDIIGQIYPWRYFSIESWKNFMIPLWNPYSFGGTPLLANYQSAVLSPLNIGFYFFPFIDWWSFLIFLQPLLAGLFTYLYLRSILVSKAGSIISSISFMFCGFITSWMGYGTLAFAILYIPLALYAIEKYFKELNSRYLILLSFTIPLSFFSGHFQMSLYFLVFIFSYIVYKYFSEKSLKKCVLIVAATLFGLFMCAPQLLPSVELYTQSVRSVLFQKLEVIPWSYAVTLLAPDFYGNPVTRNAWFGHYAEWNLYMGIIPLFLGIYALFNLKKKYTIFFLLAAIVPLALAFQTPLLDLLVFLKIPVLSTSALSRVVVLFSFSMAVLAGFGFDLLLEDLRKRKMRRVNIEIIFFCFIFSALWVFVFSGQILDLEKLQIAKSNLRLPSVIFFLFIVVLFFSYFLKKKGVVIFSVLLIVIISLDMLRFANKWLPFEPRNLVYPEIGVTNTMREISGHERVFGNFGAESSVYYKLPVLEGYDPLYIRRFGQFISSINDGKLSDSARSGVELPLAGKYLLPAANFLGVRYFIHKVSDGQNVWEFPFWEYTPESIKLLYDDGKYQVLENTNAFPRAFLVESVVRETDSQKIISRMFSDSFDLRKSAVIEEGLEYKSLASGSAKIVSYTLNAIEIETESKGDSFLVLTDVFYPGWNVKINGVKSKVYRTNFAFRGVFIPEGQNKVEFYYDPLSFKLGMVGAILGLSGIAIVAYAFRKHT